MLLSVWHLAAFRQKSLPSDRRDSPESLKYGCRPPDPGLDPVLVRSLSVDVKFPLLDDLSSGLASVASNRVKSHKSNIFLIVSWV